jgi:Tol biopolymer transport system component
VGLPTLPLRALAFVLLAAPAGAAAQQSPFLNVNPAWSPDGARIVFESRREGDADIWIMDADGSGQRRLTADAGDETHPDWAPEGDRIVFDAEEDGVWNLHVMDADGGGRRAITGGPAGAGAFARHPAWSPDGSKIAFDSERDGDIEVYVMAVDGSGSRRLTREPGMDTHPA